MKTMILAADLNWGIGSSRTESGFPWPRIPEVLKNFKNETMKTPNLVMGATTAATLGYKPLPGRTHHILSRKLITPPHPEMKIYSSVEDIMRAFRTKHCMIIGGAQTYSALAPYASHIILTKIHETYKGADCFFDSKILAEFKEDQTRAFTLRPKSEGLPLVTVHYYDRM